MSEIADSNRLIEQIIEKHNRFLEAFNTEFSEIESKLNAAREQSIAIKKEIGATESRIEVLNEKYHLLFHQAKKQREELFNQIFDRMRTDTAADIQGMKRTSARIDEFEKRLQTSKNIEYEERTIAEIKKLFYDAESAARKAGIAFSGVIDKLNEANSSHRELLSLQDKPEQNTASVKECDKQISEIEGRFNWLRHRIESHKNAVAYWEKQKGGINVG